MTGEGDNDARGWATDGNGRGPSYAEAPAANCLDFLRPR